jgi:hypothetical protein
MRKVVKVVEEGMILAVPVVDGSGFLLCVVARVINPSSVGGGLLAYFFGPLLKGIPDADLVGSLCPEVALCAVRTGVRRVLEGKWIVIGRLEPFRRTEWPIPTYGRVFEPEPELAWKVTFQDDRLDGERIETQVTPEEARRYPQDTAYGVDIAVVPALKALRERINH